MADVGIEGNEINCSVFLLFWVQCTHAQLHVNPFYHPFYSDVTFFHMSSTQHVNLQWQHCASVLGIISLPNCIISQISLIPRPCPAFCSLEYGKGGKGPSIFSHVRPITTTWFSTPLLTLDGKLPMSPSPLTGTVKAIWKQSGNAFSSFWRAVSVKLVEQLHDVAAGRTKIFCEEHDENSEMEDNSEVKDNSKYFWLKLILTVQIEQLNNYKLTYALTDAEIFLHMIFTRNSHYTSINDG